MLNNSFMENGFPAKQARGYADTLIVSTSTETALGKITVIIGQHVDL